jgi:CheY-like chemotaxis protein
MKLIANLSRRRIAVRSSGEHDQHDRERPSGTGGATAATASNASRPAPRAHPEAVSTRTSVKVLGDPGHSVIVLVQIYQGNGMSEPNTRYVLVVDDLPEQRDIYRIILEHAGFRVVEADDGETAVRLAQAHLPDVILLDVLLPGISGYEVIRRLRADRRTARIRIVVVSAVSSPENHRRAVESGCNEFLAKPAGPREVLDVVQRQGRLTSSP